MTSDPVERYLLRASRVGRRARLRPMQLAEVFDLSLRVYRTLGWRILVAASFPTLFTLGGLAFLFQYVMPGFMWTSQGTSESGQVVQAGVNMVLGVLVAGPLILIGISLATTYIAPLVSDFMHGLPPNHKAAHEAQWKSAPRMLWVSFRESLLAASGSIVGGGLLFVSWMLTRSTGSESVVAGIVLIAGIGALCVGGIGALFVVSAHALVAPIAAIERASAGLAAKRSRDLMKARTYHGSGYDSVWSLYLMLGLIALILCGGAAALVDIIGIGNHLSGVNLRQMRPVIEAAVGLIPIYLTLWVVVPVWAVTVTIIYFERRVRLEGYDIEALAADVWHPDREDRLRA